MLWVDVTDITPELALSLASTFKFHELAIEDACSAHQLPKLEEYGDSLFLVLQTAQLNEESQVAFGETHFFVGSRFLVSVRHSSSLSYTKVRERCENMPEQLAKGPGFALYALMEFIVDHYLPVAQGLEERLEQLEADIFGKDFRNETFARLYDLKRDLLLLRGATLPWLDICSELMRFHTHIIPRDTRFYFRDVHDHAQRIHQAVEGMRDMNKLKSFFQRSSQPSSRDVARQRLQLVLVHDRNHIEPGMMKGIKDEIFAVISKHIDIDRAGVQVNFTRGERESKLVADIPLSSKRQTRK